MSIPVEILNAEKITKGKDICIYRASNQLIYPWIASKSVRVNGQTSNKLTYVQIIEPEYAFIGAKDL